MPNEPTNGQGFEVLRQTLQAARDEIARLEIGTRSCAQIPSTEEIADPEDRAEVERLQQLVARLDHQLSAIAKPDIPEGRDPLESLFTLEAAASYDERITLDEALGLGHSVRTAINSDLRDRVNAIVDSLRQADDPVSGRIEAELSNALTLTHPAAEVAK